MISILLFLAFNSSAVQSWNYSSLPENGMKSIDRRLCLFIHALSNNVGR